ncbi:MAG: class I SAM-dependent methyltransferase [Spirochaetia bacterium]
METNNNVLRLKDFDLKNAAEKRTCNEIIFRRVASKYNSITRILSFYRDTAWKRRLAGRLPAVQGAVCLDLACGTGDISFLLARKYSEGRIMAVDMSAEMLSRAAALNKYENIRFKQADMCRTGFAPGTFDVVTGGYALRNAPDLGAVLKHVYMLLKPGGSALFLDFAKSGYRSIRLLQLFLLRIWGGFWGLVLHGNPDLYAYIAESLALFPDISGLSRMLTVYGFKKVKIKLLFWGMMSLVVCRK